MPKIILLNTVIDVNVEHTFDSGMPRWILATRKSGIEQKISSFSTKNKRAHYNINLIDIYLVVYLVNSNERGRMYSFMKRSKSSSLKLPMD